MTQKSESRDRRAEAQIPSLTRRRLVQGAAAAGLVAPLTGLIAPSAAFVASLPNAKLPDRNDFYRYASDHPARIVAWKRAVAECQRFADEAAAWLCNPDLSLAESF